MVATCAVPLSGCGSGGDEAATTRAPQLASQPATTSADPQARTFLSDAAPVPLDATPSWLWTSLGLSPAHQVITSARTRTNELRFCAAAFYAMATMTTGGSTATQIDARFAQWPALRFYLDSADSDIPGSGPRAARNWLIGDAESGPPYEQSCVAYVQVPKRHSHHSTASQSANPPSNGGTDNNPCDYGYGYGDGEYTFAIIHTVSFTYLGRRLTFTRPCASVDPAGIVHVSIGVGDARPSDQAIAIADRHRYFDVGQVSIGTLANSSRDSNCSDVIALETATYCFEPLRLRDTDIESNDRVLGDTSSSTESLLGFNAEFSPGKPKGRRPIEIAILFSPPPSASNLRVDGQRVEPGRPAVLGEGNPSDMGAF